jgi:hypothetical protein
VLSRRQIGWYFRFFIPHFICTNKSSISHQLEEAIDSLLAASPNMTIQEQESHKIVQARNFLLEN